MPKKPVLDMTPEEYARLTSMTLLEQHIEATARAMENPQKHKLDKADLQRMNVPEEFWPASLALVTPSVRKEIGNYEKHLKTFEGSGSGLYLHGKPGVGKTGAAVTLLKFVRERYRSGYFIKVGELREAMRYQHDFDASETISTRVRAVDFLVLDALTEHDLKLPYFGLEDMMALVAQRGETHKPTVITSTLEPSLMAFAQADFFSTVGKFLVSQQVTGENRRVEDRKNLSKLLKGD